MKSQNIKLKEDLLESQNKALEVSHQLLQYKQSNENLTQELSEATALIKEKNGEIKSLEKDIQKKDKVISPENDEINQLHAEVAKSTQELDEKNALLETNKKDIETLKNELSGKVEKESIDTAEMHRLELEVEKNKKDIEDKNQVIEKFRTDIETLKKEISDNIPTDGSQEAQELQRLRTLVLDREKSIKKINESHKKELKEVECAKTNAEENLNSAIQENTKVKEKESTMYDILEGLKRLLEIEEKRKDTTTTMPESEKPEVEIIDNGAAGGARKKTSFSCQKCNFSSTNMENINKHMRSEHLTTLYPCVKCDLQAKSITELQHHTQSEYGEIPIDNVNTNQLRNQCNICSFIGVSEEALQTHKSKYHSQLYECNVCDYFTENKSHLRQHITSNHNQTRYQCDVCSYFFSTSANLEAHKVEKHNHNCFPCNDCRFKAKSLDNLDAHIKECHGSPRKDFDIRNVEKKTACNPSHPLHSTTCCDREPGQSYQRMYTEEEKRQFGACYYWNQGYCKRGDLCKFLHIELCRYQDNCRRSGTCEFFHIKKADSFLGGRRQHQYVYREEDFPVLDQIYQNKRRNM